MTSTLFSFTVSRPLGGLALVLTALSHFTMLGLHAAFHPWGHWILLGYLSGSLTCIGITALVIRFQLTLRPRPSSKTFSGSEAAVVFSLILLFPLFEGLRVFLPRQTDTPAGLFLKAIIVAVSAGVVVAAVMELTNLKKVWQGKSKEPIGTSCQEQHHAKEKHEDTPALLEHGSDEQGAPGDKQVSQCVTIRDFIKHSGIPLITVALWIAVFFSEKIADADLSGVITTIAGGTALGILLGFFLNRGQPRLVHGLAAVSILSAAAATLLPSAPGILTAVAVSAVSLSAGLVRRSAFSLMLAALLLILPLLILLLGILAALLLTGAVS